MSILNLATNVAYAAETTKVCDNVKMDSIAGIFNWASCTLVKAIVPFLVTLATVAFIWGVIQYFLNPDNEEKRKKGKEYILWGLIALFVMVSMWGLVALLSDTFGVTSLIPQLSQ